jgi:hypothetical protein
MSKQFSGAKVKQNSDANGKNFSVIKLHQNSEGNNILTKRDHHSSSQYKTALSREKTIFSSEDEEILSQ